MKTMGMQFSVEEKQLIETAKTFRDEFVAPFADHWERDRRVPVETLKLAADRGLLRLETPKQNGGHGARFSVKMKLSEVLAESCMAFSFSMINTQNVAAKIAKEGSAEAVDRYVDDLMKGNIFGATALTEPTAGSDFSHIKMRASETDGGWMLNGKKAWITNAAIADVYVVFAQTDAAKGWRGIASFLVDSREKSFTRDPAFQMLGAHAIGAGGFALSDYYVPNWAVMAGPGEAFKRAMSSINGARTYVAAMCCGMVQSGLNTAVSYARERKAFGQSISNHQGLRWVLADIATELQAARLLTEQASLLIDQGSSEAMLAAAHAKKYAARLAEKSIPQCIQILGANGLREEYGLGRHLACAKVAHYVDGSTEIQNDRIAASLLD
jgi:alkylation response protein AidB-like acyl-CoA dehydrogenase